MEVLTPPTILQTDFDQFHRYGAVSLLLKPLLRELGRPARILEVGSNELAVLGDFLKPIPVELVRCDVEDFPGDDFVRVRRDAPLPFEAGSFDFTVALEVLEHIPAEERLFAVSEWLRVASSGVLLTCPNGSPEVQEVEARAARAFRRRQNRPHPWLQEHEDFGLPTDEAVAALFEKLGVPYHVFGNSPLAEWLPLLLLTEELCGSTPPAVLRMFNRFLNAGPRSLLTRQRPYRKVYACFKDREQASWASRRWRVAPLNRTATTEVDPAADVDPVAVLAGQLRDVFCRQSDELVRREREKLRLANELDRVQTKLLVTQRALTEQQCETKEQERRSLLHRFQWERLWFAWPAQLQAWLEKWTPGWFSWSRPHGLEEAETRQLILVPNSSPQRWEAVGDDPQFRFARSLPAGWVRIELAAHLPAGAVPKLYYDIGDGYQECYCLEFGRWNGPKKQVYYYRFDQPVQVWRFDPMEAPGFFEIRHFSVRPCTTAGVVGGGVVKHLRGCCRPSRLLFKLSALAGLLRKGGNSRGLLSLLNPLPEKQPVAEPEPPYRDWLAAHRLTDAECLDLSQRLAQTKSAPLLSLFLPLADVQPEGLRRTLKSLERQAYEAWDLALAAPAAAHEAVTTILAELPVVKARTRLEAVPPPYSASAALRLLLDQASGELFVPVDQGDELAREALLVLANEIVRQPGIDYFYSDEDERHPQGGNQGPRFKPDWSPDHYLAEPYTGRLAAYRTERCRAVGGIHAAFDGAHEFDLVLRLTAGRRHNVGHIPRVLYHRGAPNRPPVRPEAAAEVLTWHASQHHIDLRVEPDRAAATYRVRFPIPGHPKVSIIIPTAGRPARIKGKATTFVSNCIESLLARSTYASYEIILVVNRDLPADVLKQVDGSRIRRLDYREPFSFAAACNRGAAQATGDYLLFLNDDTEVITPDWLELLLEYACRPGIGAVGAKLFFPDGRLQHTGVLLLAGQPSHPFYLHPGSSGGYLRSTMTPRNYLAVTAACLMTPRAIFESAGGLNPRFPLNYNDVDYCLRLHECGLRIVYTPYAQLYHYEGATKGGGSAVYGWEQERFKETWGQSYARDPYFNDNLSTKYLDYRRKPVPPR